MASDRNLPIAGDPGPSRLLAMLNGHITLDDIHQTMEFSVPELDLLYECVRLQANELRRRQLHAGSPDVEPGSWADRIHKLDRRLTTELHRRRQHAA